MNRYRQLKEAMLFFMPYWRRGTFPIVNLFIVTVISFVFPLFPKWALDEVVGKKNTGLLPRIVVFFLVLVVLQRFFSYLYQTTFFKFERQSILDIQKKLVDRILNYPMEFFNKNHSGYIMGRIRGDVAGLGYIFSDTLVMAVMEFFKFWGSLFILITMNVKLTFICCIPIPIILFEIYRNRKDIKDINKSLIQENAKVEQELSDTFQGIEVLKTFSKEKEGSKRTENSLRSYQEIEIKRKLLISRYNNTITLISNIGGTLLLFFGISDIIANKISIGSYMAFSIYLGYLYTPVQNLSHSFVSIDHAKRSYDRISELLKLLPEDNGSIEISEIDNVEINNLNFSYDGKQEIFNGFNLCMKKGDKVLFKGKSGSGKSTLTKLLLGLYRPSKGEVYYNGVELREINLNKLREKIGFISQNTFLFNKTIRENILFSNNHYTNEELFQILDQCRIKDKILSLANGIDHVVSEKGDDFSGGEKQRISLARALVKKPDLIILDEATSNIDKETRAEIENIIHEQFKDKIIIEISHDQDNNRRYTNVINLDTNKKHQEDAIWN